MRHMAMVSSGLIVLAGAALGLADEGTWPSGQVRATGHAVALPGQEFWRLANRCGVNSLFMMARLSGIPADYGTVQAAVPVTSKGTSLSDLRRFAIRIGIDAEVRRITPAILEALPMPVIAHVEQKEGQTNHYVVVTVVRPDGVEAIDGTTAILRFIPMVAFKKSWTGYVLVRRDSSLEDVILNGMLLAGAWLLATGLFSPKMRRVIGALRQHLIRLPRRRAGTVVLVIALSAPLGPVHAADGAVTLGDITNGIKSQWGRINGLAIDYIYKEQNLVDMIHVKRYLGVKILNRRHSVFAFKANKRYRMEKYLQTKMRDLAPSIEPDYGIIPNGIEIKRKLDARRAVNKLWPQDKATFTIPPGIETAFNGSTVRRKEPGAEGANAAFGSSLAIELPEHIRNERVTFRQEYLENLARVLPDALHAENDRRADRLPDAFGADHFIVRSEAEIVDGAPCVVIERHGSETFWLDPKLNYSVRMAELFYPDSKIVMERRRNSRFEEVQPGIWLPKLCWRDLCGPPKAPDAYRGKPLVRHEYEVTSLVINDVPDALFELTAPPGWIIADATLRPQTGNDGTDKYVSYVMPADQNMLEEVTRRALDAGSAPHRGKVWMVFVTANALVIVAFIGYSAYRRLLRRKASPSR
jgi:hypothetical protein